jgi:hypothetical protein
LNGTYLTQYRQQSLDDGSFPNIVGTRGDVGSIPRWKHVLTIDWTRGPWNATLIENYVHRYSEACATDVTGRIIFDPSGCITRTVAAYEIWDLSGGYTGFQNTTLRLGIKNLANRDPPASNQVLTAHYGYDEPPTRGRTFYGLCATRSDSRCMRLGAADFTDTQPFESVAWWYMLPPAQCARDDLRGRRLADSHPAARASLSPSISRQRRSWVSRCRVALIRADKVVE